MAAGSNPQFTYVPDYLDRLGIKPGEWMATSIPTLRVLVRPGQPRQVRIFGCLLLQANGYNTDLAVAQSRSEKGKSPKIVPMTPGGIASMLYRETVAAFREAGITLTDDQRSGIRQATAAHMRRDLADMEEQGILSRVRLNVPWEQLKITRTTVGGNKINAWKTLGESLEEDLVTDFQDLPTAERQKCANGKVAVYLHARPRADKNVSVEGLDLSEDGTQTQADHFTQILFNFTRALRRDPERAAELAAREDVRNEIESYERSIAVAKGRLKDFLEPIVNGHSTTTDNVPVANAGHCTLPISNKPQGRISTDRAKSTHDQGRQAGIPAPERDRADRAAPPQVSAANPNGRGDRGEMPIKAVPPAAAAEPEVSPAETSTILEVMRRFVRADRGAAEKYICLCRGFQPTCTVAQMASALIEKGPVARSGRNPTGLLIHSAVELFQTEAQEKPAEEVIVGAFSGEVQRKEAKPAPTLTEMAERVKKFRAGGGR